MSSIVPIHSNEILHFHSSNTSIEKISEKGLEKNFSFLLENDNTDISQVSSVSNIKVSENEEWMILAVIS